MISKIEEFHQHYNQFCKELYDSALAIEWIIIAEAANLK